MTYYDQHLHTHFSYDSQADFTDYLAHSSGFVVTTEHFDVANPVTGHTDAPDYASYSAEIDKLNQDILDVIEACKVKTLVNTELFDVYTGENVAVDKNSLTYTLTFQSADHQLKDDDIMAAMSKMTRNFVTFGAELR